METENTRFEVEMKFRVADLAEVRQRVLAQPGKSTHAETDSDHYVEQVDTYMAHPCRDFARTGEAFRIRREGVETWLTYKGPRLEGPTKTREEVEFASQWDEATFQHVLRLWARLGFRPVATVRKQRAHLSVVEDKRSIDVTLDSVMDLGSFVEVETIAFGSDDVASARQAVLDLSQRLGLTDVEPRSYLRMALDRARDSAGPKFLDLIEPAPPAPNRSKPGT